MNGKEIWDKITDFSNQKSGQLLGRELRDQTLALEPVKTALQQEADFAIELIDKAIRSAKWETANRGLIYADNHGQEIMEGDVRSLFNAMMEGLSIEDCLSRAEMEKRYIDLCDKYHDSVNRYVEKNDEAIALVQRVKKLEGQITDALFAIDQAESWFLEYAQKHFDKGAIEKYELNMARAKNIAHVAYDIRFGRFERKVVGDGN